MRPLVVPPLSPPVELLTCPTRADDRDVNSQRTGESSAPYGLELGVLLKRAWQAVHVEDGLLVAAMAVAMLFWGRVGRDALHPGPYVGALYVAGVGGAMACSLTRPRGPRPVFLDSEGGPNYPAYLLLYPSLLLSFVGFRELGYGDAGETLAIWYVAVVLVSLYLAPWLPPVSLQVRRSLMLPMISASSFVLFSLGGDFGPARFAGLMVGEFGVSFLGILVGGAIGLGAWGLIYLLLVVAPRQLAGEEGTGEDWLIRYLVFFAASRIYMGAGRLA